MIQKTCSILDAKGDAQAKLNIEIESEKSKIDIKNVKSQTSKIKHCELNIKS